MSPELPGAGLTSPMAGARRTQGQSRGWCLRVQVPPSRQGQEPRGAHTGTGAVVAGPPAPPVTCPLATRVTGKHMSRAVLGHRACLH